MKPMKLGLWLAGAMAGATIGWGWPYGASDATYGLRSRIDENPSFKYTASPADWRDINMYQLFTDRFADSGDQLSSYKPSWKCDGISYPYNRNYHHGGDYKGLKNNLDYLSGMGVRAIWMSGVQMNDQGKDTRYTPYHQYHPDDFFKCDPAMGTFQELKDLIDACHARGIYVVLDVVPNHMCDKNGLWGNSQQDDKQYWASGNGTFGWWNDANKHAAPFTDLQYFHNNGTITCWDCSPENLLGQFKGTDDLKTENTQVQGWLDEAFKNLIDATDCDGFRVDAIKHVEYNWIKQWADNMRKHAAYRGKNDFIIFGEYFSYDNGALANFCKDAGYSFNSALFFPMSQNIKNVFVDNQGSGQLTQQLNNKSQYGEGANRLVAFIDNHDLNRIALQDGGNVDNVVWDMRPALTFLYTGTPVPCLFYGTEHAFNQGGHWNGSNKTDDNPDDGDWQRECMFDKGFQPGPAQGNKLAATNAPLYQHIAALNRARANHRSLCRGTFTERWSSGGAGAYAYSRVLEQEEALVALNTADGDVSINPQVGKPDGTEFYNTLNTSEKAVVSGGRISFSLSGKQSKIFVAGSAPGDLWVRSTQNYPAAGDVTPATELWINTEAGPTGKVASAKVGYNVDGGTNWALVAMGLNTNWSSQGGNWYNVNLGTFAPGAVVKYYVEVADASSNKVWDNNGGLNYTVTVGQGATLWIRNTKNYPLDGEATDGTDLYVDTEAGPSGTVAGATTFYTTNGTAWTSTAMAVHADWGSDGGVWYGADLGRFAAGSVVRYYITATDGASTATNNNGGLNFQVTIRSGGTNDLWVGNTTQNPTNGGITASSVIQINAETWPIGAATNVALVYSPDGGVHWTNKPMAKVGSAPANDVWQTVTGPYADGTVVQYAIAAESAAVTNWDNNGGMDYRAIVGQVDTGLMITNPPTNMAVPNEVATYTLQGTATAVTSGVLRWTNALTGFAGQIAATTPWSIPSVALAVGTNLITVSGTSTGGGTGSVVAADSVANYGGSWTNGSNHGSGFEPWQLAAEEGNSGQFIGALGFGLWSHEGGHLSQAVRPFSSPLAVGHTFTVRMQNGWIWESGGSVGIALRNSAGDSLWELYFNGGDTNYSRTGGTTDIGWTDAGLSVAFTLTASGAYSVAVQPMGGTARTYTGTFSGTIAQFRAWSYNNGTTDTNNPKRDFFFDELSIAGSGAGPGATISDFVAIAREEAVQDSNGDGIPDSWCQKYGLDPLAPNLAGQAAPNGYRYGDCYGMDLDPADLSTPPFLMDLVVSNRFTFGAPEEGRQYMLQYAPHMNEPFVDLEGIDVGQIMEFGAATQGFYRVRFLGGGGGPVTPESVNVVATPGTTSFTNAGGMAVTLYVSGVNVVTSTYVLGSAAAVAYTNGTQIQVGAALASGQSVVLNLYGATATGVVDTASYTYTKTGGGTAITNVGATSTYVSPSNEVWIDTRALPEGSSAAAYIVYCVNPPCSGDWPLVPMERNPDWENGDWWHIGLGVQPNGTVIKYSVMMVDGLGAEHWDNNNGNDYTVTIGGSSTNTPSGSFKPYSTNPTFGQYRSAGIAIDGANTGGEWTTNMLVALDMANDDPRSLGGNWTMHEAPIDFTHLWACWDDNNLYVAWQLVDVTDKIDPANAGSAGGGKISNNQGLLIWAVLDTQAGGSTGDMWSKSNTWSGANTPDMQLYMNGNFYSAYMGKPVGGVYNTPTGGATNDNYKTFDGWGIVKGKGDVYAGGAQLWGVGDVDNRAAADAPNRDFIAEGHATSATVSTSSRFPSRPLGSPRPSSKARASASWWAAAPSPAWTRSPPTTPR